MKVPETHGKEDVGVSYFGDSFVITVAWTREADQTDETVLRECSEWFTEQYGFDPSLHSIREDVNNLYSYSDNG